jgi:hypothetical protein
MSNLVLLRAANTPFRPFHGPFTLTMDLSGPLGIAVTLNGSGTFDALPVNEGGRVNGTAQVTVTVTATVTAPGINPTTETDSGTSSEAVSQTLFEYLSENEDAQQAFANVAYSFSTAGNEIVLRFDTTETLQNFVIEGIAFNGTAHLTGTLTAPFNEARSVQTQTFQSLFRDNVFTGFSGLDTVEYAFSPRSVVADLQSGSGVNAFGGTDRYSSIENLTGSAFNDILAGDSANNGFIAGAGNDTLNGRLGIDIAAFSSARAAYIVTRSGATTTVSGPDGIDTLTDIERLQFSDKNIAVDLGAGESAGMTVRIIGAAFDTARMTPDLVGIGIGIFDAGASMLRVCELALDTPLFLSLAGSHSNVDFVNTVYRNVVGTVPTAPVRDSLVNLLQGSGGTMSQAELLMLAANVNENGVNINVVGLQQSGVEFV